MTFVRKLQESSKLELELMPKARIRLAKEGHSKTEYSNITFFPHLHFANKDGGLHQTC